MRIPAVLAIALSASVIGGAAAGASRSSSSTVIAPTTTAGTATVAVAEFATLMDAIGVVQMMSIGETILPKPDQQCFSAAVATAPPDAQDAARLLEADPFAWASISPEARQPLVAAYVGCSDIGDVLLFVALGTINSFDASDCIVPAWIGTLTPELIASSMAYGFGLDDLPADVVARLVDGVVRCMPEPEWTDWWIDDIALELEVPYDLTMTEATCVARNFVSVLGVPRAVERRVLTMPILTLPDRELAAVVEPCGVTVTLPPIRPGEVGDCFADVFEGGELRPVPCSSPHNGELYAAIDLSADVPTWPGIAAIHQRGVDACGAAIVAFAAGRRDIGYVPLVPQRRSWERGERFVLCMMGPNDGSDWVGPSGLVPTTTSQPLPGN